MAFSWPCPASRGFVQTGSDAEDTAGIPMHQVCNSITSPDVLLARCHEAQASSSISSSSSANNMIINGAPVGGKAGCCARQWSSVYAGCPLQTSVHHYMLINQTLCVSKKCRQRRKKQFTLNGSLLLNESLLLFLYNPTPSLVQTRGEGEKKKITILVTSSIHTRWEACHTNQMRQACLASHLAEKTIFPHSLSNKDGREMAVLQPVCARMRVGVH